MSDLKIAVIVADSDEYVPFAKAVEKGEFEEYSFLGRKGHKFTVKTQKGSATVYSLLCGIGMVNAAAAAAHFATIGCDIILNYGLSGGVSGIGKGEFELGRRFFVGDGAKRNGKFSRLLFEQFYIAMRREGRNLISSCADDVERLCSYRAGRAEYGNGFHWVTPFFFALSLLCSNKRQQIKHRVENGSD